MKDVYTISNEESQRIEIMKVIMCFGVCFVQSGYLLLLIL